MRAIVTQLAYLLVSILALYLGILLLTLFMFPSLDGKKGPIDTASASHTLYVTEPKYVVMSRSSLAVDRPRVVFVGASNTVVGFKQPQVAAALPELEVDSLGVGGANITEVSQVVDLVEEAESDASRRDTTFVISIWYGEFAEDRFKWRTPDRVAGDTDINIEQYRYGFYRRSDTGPVAVLPASDLSLEVALIRPYLVVDKLSRVVTSRLRASLFHVAENRTDAERDATTLSEAEKVHDLAYWQDEMHAKCELSDEQFLILRATIGRILASGGKVVLVDLPIPRWHSERSPFYESYRQKRDVLLRDMQNTRGFTFVDMSGQDDDLDFSDEVHPKPSVSSRWASFIAAALRTDLIANSKRASP